jgi:Holliday junction resolvase RusA-like endonuclease
VIEFVVYGDALPKGSAKAFIPKGWSRPVITSTTKGLKEWEAKIAAAAQIKCDGILLTGPVTLEVRFYLARPKSLPKRTTAHIKRPDLDKLIRGATDALTGVIWKDDSQVTLVTAGKTYVATAAEAPRAEFRIAAEGSLL